MPVLDNGDCLMDSQAVTAAAIGTRIKDAGTKPAVSHLEATNPVAATKDWASGDSVVAWASVKVADVATAVHVKFEIIAADDAALTSNPVVLATMNKAASALKKDTRHRIGTLAPGTKKRYLGCKVSGFTDSGMGTTANISAASFSVFLQAEENLGIARNQVGDTI